MNVNCNDIREKAGRFQLAEMLRKLKVGVCVLTETHLRLEEAEHLHFKYFAVVTGRRRTNVKQIAGGAMILVHRNYKIDKFERRLLENKAVEHCFIRLYVSEDPLTTFLLSGAQASPETYGGDYVGRFLEILRQEAINPVASTSTKYHCGRFQHHAMSGAVWRVACKRGGVAS